MSSMMEYKGYHAKVEYDAEDGILIGKVFGVCDTIIFDGETVKEIEAVFHQSIDDYVKHCAEIDKEPDKEYKGSFNIRIPTEMHKRLALLAEDNDQSINQIVISALDEYMNPSEMSRGIFTYVIREEIQSSPYTPQSIVRDEDVADRPSLRLCKGGSKSYGVH